MPQRQNTPEDGQRPTHEQVIELIHQEARAGAQRILQAALEAEVEEHVKRFCELTDADGHQAVVRNGHAPARSINTGVGSLEVRRPRVDERKAKEKDSNHREFTSAVLPKYFRRTPTLDGSLATLYLLGVSTNDFPLALRSLLGEQADTISASTITRLKREWEAEYDQWRQSKLTDEEYAYLWADGIYFNVRLDEERSCILVVVGSNYRGEKKLLALQDGYRESKQSWKEALMSMKKRGLKGDPKLVIGDGGLGLWAALPEVFPGSATQRCWVHKTANVLDKMPKSVQGRPKKTKGCGSRQATLAMTFKLIEEAQKTWRKLQGWQTLKLVHDNRRFVDGELVEESTA